MEVLEDRYMRRIEIVEGLELQQRLVPGRDLRNCLRDRRLRQSEIETVHARPPVCERCVLDVLGVSENM
eukprot:4053481-Amphidinium_carterae.1